MYVENYLNKKKENIYIVHVRYAQVWFVLAMYISYCLCQFCSHWVAIENMVSVGKYRLKLFYFFIFFTNIMIKF